MEWKQIPGTVYKISDTGIIIGCHPNYPNHELKHDIHPRDGHHGVTLMIDGHKKKCFVHKLVALMFIPNPDNLPFVNHKDEDPHNNSVENLEWCSAQYNNTYKDVHKRRGELERYPVEVYSKDGLVEVCESVTDCVSKKYGANSTIYKHTSEDNPSKKGYWFIIKRHNKRSRSKSQETIS